jgi:hypothetical protein
MDLFFGICAALGGTVLVCQFVMTLLGLAELDVDLPDDGGHAFGDHGGGHDVGHDAGHGHGHDSHDHAHHGANWLFSIVTFRTLTAALTFFGLTGLAMRSLEVGQATPSIAVLVALAAGGAAMYGVHWLLTAISRLRSEGTVRIDHAVGHGGEVYLRIPANRSGVGKVTITQQNRTVEYQAMTPHEALPTGAKIVVIGIVGPDTVEVELASAREPSAVQA